MKTKPDKLGTIKKLLGCFGAFAGAGLLMLALMYLDVNRQLAIGERNAALTTTMVEVARLNVVLHQLGAGQADKVKEMLSAQLAYNLTAIDAQASAADPQYLPFAKMVLEAVAQDERRNPEYYPGSTTPINLVKTQMAQVVQH